MITIAQRCSSAKVSVNKTIISEIKSGLLLLVGVEVGDQSIDIKKTVNKNEINVLYVVSDNPKILNVTSLQLTLFCCNCLSISSLDSIVASL